MLEEGLDQRSGDAVKGVTNETAARATKANKGVSYLDARADIVAALLAFYTPGQPEVFEVKHWDRPNQYDYWPDLRRGSDALLVVHRKEEVPEITRRSFAEIVPLPDDTLTIERHGGTAQRLRAYFCRSYAPDSATSH